MPITSRGIPTLTINWSSVRTIAHSVMGISLAEELYLMYTDPKNLGTMPTVVVENGYRYPLDFISTLIALNQINVDLRGSKRASAMHFLVGIKPAFLQDLRRVVQLSEEEEQEVAIGLGKYCDLWNEGGEVDYEFVIEVSQ